MCQGAASVLREFLQDWRVLLTQLEHQFRLGRLSLQALSYHLQPAQATLRLLAGVCSEAAQRGLRGAGLLNLLHSREQALAGNQAARAVVLRVLTGAAGGW